VVDKLFRFIPDKCVL